MRFWLKYIFITGFILVSQHLFGQQQHVVQFSGYITAEGTDIAVPYVTIRNTSYGNEIYTANHEGFFTFVAHVGDVIALSSIGYEAIEVTVPPTVGDKYTIRLEMKPLIEELPVVTVGPPLPWASIEEFNREFLALNSANDEILTAQRNLSPQALSALSRIVPRNAEEIQTYNSLRRHINMSNQAINQNMANPLLNPFAWGQLINQIKRGDYSRQRLKY